MRKANYDSIENPILVDTKGLRALTQLGRDSAVKIGMEANARVQIGKSVRWKVDKVEEYLKTITSV